MLFYRGWTGLLNQDIAVNKAASFTLPKGFVISYLPVGCGDPPLLGGIGHYVWVFIAFRKHDVKWKIWKSMRLEREFLDD